MAKINFHFQSKIFNVSRKRKLTKHIENIFNMEKKTLNVLNVIFCTDRYLLKINKQFLHHDDYTDVISFDLSPYKNEIIGEIYISIDRVRQNAKNYSKSFIEELYTVIIHGILHLCGYRDKGKKDLQNMREAQNFYLRNMKEEELF